MMRIALPVWVAACTFAVAAMAQAPGASSPASPGSRTIPSSTSTTPPLRVQYDQVREFFAPGTPPPAPGAFEQEYAKVKAQLDQPLPPMPDARELAEKQIAALEADQIKQRFINLARGEATTLLTAAVRGLANANPVVGMLVDRVVSGAEARVEERIAAQRQAAANRKRVAQARTGGTQAAMAALGRLPALQRISIWDGMVRIDNPREHTAVVYQPDRHRYLVIDDAHRFYRIVAGDAPTTSPDGCDSRIVSFSDRGAGSFDGVAVHAYQLVTQTRLEDMDVVATRTFELWATPVAPNVLALASGSAECPADSPAVDGRYPVDRLALYSAMTSQMRDTEDDDDDAMLPSAGINSVMMRGHLRTLTAADHALFEPPPGYRRIQ